MTTTPDTKVEHLEHLLQQQAEGDDDDLLRWFTTCDLERLEEIARTYRTIEEVHPATLRMIEGMQTRAQDRRAEGHLPSVHW
jgi:hypothetical protein